MEHMYTKTERLRKGHGDVSQLTNWIFDSGATFNMTTEISDFIPGLLVETQKNIEVADGNFITEKKIGEFQIKFLTILENHSLIRYTM